MKEHTLTLKELADIGAKASRSVNGLELYGNLTVDPNRCSYNKEAPFREAFAEAVRDAVLADLVTKSDSLPEPEPVLIPLDIDDIRATDEFRKPDSTTVCVATIWTNEFIWLSGKAGLKYSTLAANYLRRQHGSTEWKPCTKESK